MKNLKILLGLFAIIALYSCDPLEDDINELNDEYAYKKDVEYTLTDDDYDLANDECSCLRSGGFQSEDDVKAYIPLVLNDVFPALGKGSSAKIHYNFYNGSGPDLNGDYEAFTVSEAEYLELGYTYKNFDNLDSDIPTYAEYKWPDAGDGDYMDITHAYYNGSFTEYDVVSRAVYTVAYGWKRAFILPDAAYGDFFFESGIDFSTESEGAEKMPVYLNYLLSSASDYYSASLEAGATMLVQYNFDDRFTDPDNPGLPNVPSVALYIFDGTEWKSYYDGYQVIEQELNFGNDGTTWVPDNTVKYTINSTSDVDIIVADGTIGDAAALANLNQYRNFNLSNWSTEQIYDAIELVLKTKFPSSEVGQKYLVTYSTYPDGDKTVYLILDESGDYIIYEEE